MIKVKFLRKSFLTPFGRFKTYIFCFRFLWSCDILKSWNGVNKEERLYARDRRTRARSRGHFRFVIPTTREVRNSYNISDHPVYLTFRVIGLRNVQDISMKQEDKTLRPFYAHACDIWDACFQFDFPIRKWGTTSVFKRMSDNTPVRDKASRVRSFSIHRF